MPKSDDVPIKREKKKIIKKRENDHETERERGRESGDYVIFKFFSKDHFL